MDIKEVIYTSNMSTEGTDTKCMKTGQKETNLYHGNTNQSKAELTKSLIYLTERKMVNQQKKV